MHPRYRTKFGPFLSGFNQCKPPLRTVALAVNFSKAFDTVPHLSLLQQLASTTLPPNLTRWLSSYLLGRSACCQYQSARSVTLGSCRAQSFSPASLISLLYTIQQQLTSQLRTPTISRPLPRCTAWLIPQPVWRGMPPASKLGPQQESVHISP